MAGTATGQNVKCVREVVCPKSRCVLGTFLPSQPHFTEVEEVTNLPKLL